MNIVSIRNYGFAMLNDDEDRGMMQMQRYAMLDADFR